MKKITSLFIFLALLTFSYNAVATGVESHAEPEIKGKVIDGDIFICSVVVPL